MITKINSSKKFVIYLVFFAVLSEDISILLISSATDRSYSKLYFIKFVLFSSVSQ